MPVPTLVPTEALNAVVADVTYHIQGELVPVLAIELDRMPVFFEHHVMLYKDPQVNVHIKSLAGAFKRILAGMPVFMTEVVGPGRIAFSRDGAGHIIPVHLQQGQSLNVREHQFLAATGNIDFTFQWVKGVSNMLFGGTGLFVDTFTCMQGEGCVWLHGYGNIFEVNLGYGEAIDIEPGGWIYTDPTVQMQTMVQNLQTTFFASAGAFTWNRFTGPGRIGLQSMYQAPFTGGNGADGTQTTGQGSGATDVVGSVFKLFGG
jgi:uncharacterized protein (AIM24 family)